MTDHADLTARLREVAHNLRADDEELDAQAVDRGLALIAELRSHITALSGDVARLTAERDDLAAEKAQAWTRSIAALTDEAVRLCSERDEALAREAQLREAGKRVRAEWLMHHIEAEDDTEGPAALLALSRAVLDSVEVPDADQ